MDWEERLRQWSAELELAEQFESDRWVSLARAEELSGASRSTLRTWYRSDRVRSRLVDGPHGPQRLVAAQDVIDAAGRSAHIQRRSERELALEARLAALAGRVDALEARLTELEAVSPAGRSDQTLAAAARPALRPLNRQPPRKVPSKER